MNILHKISYDGHESVIEKPHNNCIMKNISGPSISFSDGSDHPITKLRIFVNKHENFHGYGKAWEAGTDKNLLPPFIEEGTVNGITFTYNEGGTVSWSGTATKAIYFASEKITLPAGTYRFIGTPYGGSASTYNIHADLYNGNDIQQSLGVDEGNGFSFTLAEESVVQFVAHIAAGVAATSNAWRPMVSTQGGVFRPYENKATLDLIENVLLKANESGYMIDMPDNFYGGWIDILEGRTISIYTHENGDTYSSDPISGVVCYDSGVVTAENADITFVERPATYSSNAVFLNNFSDLKKPGITNVYCDGLTTKSSALSGCIYGDNNSGVITITLSKNDVTDKESALAWFGEGKEIYYEVSKTMTVKELQELCTQTGDNKFGLNMDGTIEMIYCVDIKTLIENGAFPTDITDPQDGQVMKYDAASGKWVNGEGGGSAAPLLVTVNLDENNYGTLDRTWEEINNAMPNVVLKEIHPDGSFYVGVPFDRYGKNQNSETFTYFTEGQNIYSIDTPSGYPTYNS